MDTSENPTNGDASAPPASRPKPILHRKVTAVAAACTVAGVVAIAAVGTFPWQNSTPPNGGPTRPVALTMSEGAGSNPAPAAPLEILADNVIHRADGTLVVLRLPHGAVADKAAQAKGGWVVAAESNLFFADSAGGTRGIGRIRGNFAISPDGQTLITTSSGNSHEAVEAYRLPSLRLLRRTTFRSGMGPIVVGINGDRVVLKGAQGSPAPSKAAIWNLHTGELRTTGTEVDVWGGTGSGTVLRRVGVVIPGKGVSRDGCVDVVPLSDRLATARTGLCDQKLGGLEGRGSLSPDGRWIVWSVAGKEGDPDGTVLLRTEALQAGRWQPQQAPISSRDILFWDTAETFVANVDEGIISPYVRCGVATECVPIATPRVASGAPATLVQPLGV